MKNIKDYLHLYLGCQCLVSESEYYESGQGKLVRVDIEDDEAATISGNTLHDRTRYCVEADFKDIKPILRPLSDMTKPEALEFINDVFNFKGQFGHRIDNYKIEKGFLSFTYFNGNGPKGGNDQTVLLIKNWSKEGMGEWIFNCSYSMNDVVWLLKNHFDLFGLIESGLAIDATTINKPQVTNP